MAWYGLLRRWWWSGLAAVAVGIGLVIWIGVEIAIVGFTMQPPLQLIYGLFGVIIIVLALMPSTRHSTKYPNSQGG